MSVTLSRKIVNIISTLGIVTIITATVCSIRLDVFKDINALRELVGQSTIPGPIIFTLTQIIQMVIPIIPGGISCVAGVLIFGPTMSFVYNYAGIVLGSIIISLLDHSYGKPFIMSLVSDKTYNKYIGWLDNKRRLERLFVLAILFPIVPDDALCLMAGLAEMFVKKLTLIILLAKPASIHLYSPALICGGTSLTSLPGM